MFFSRARIVFYIAASIVSFQDFSQAQSSQLTDSTATTGPFSVSQQQTATQFNASLQQAQTTAITSAVELKPTDRQPNIPADASPALQAFLTTQAALANAHAQIHNQLVRITAASGGNLTFAQVMQMEKQEDKLFRQQNAAALALQQQRSQAVADASPQTVQLVPGPVVIPTNTTPQLATYLTLQNQLRKSLIQVRNQYVNSDPATREAALQTWREQNANQFGQLRQAAQNLAEVSISTQN